MKYRVIPDCRQKTKWIVLNILPLFLPVFVLSGSIYLFAYGWFYPTEQNTEKVELTIVETWTEESWFIKWGFSCWLRDDKGNVYRYPHYYQKDIQQIMQSKDAHITTHVGKRRNGDSWLETLESNGAVLHDLGETQRRLHISCAAIALLVMVLLYITIYIQPLRQALRNPEYKRLRRYRKRRRRAIKTKENTRERLVRKKDG